MLTTRQFVAVQREIEKRLRDEAAAAVAAYAARPVRVDGPAEREEWFPDVALAVFGWRIYRMRQLAAAREREAAHLVMAERRNAQREAIIRDLPPPPVVDEGVIAGHSTGWDDETWLRFGRMFLLHDGASAAEHPLACPAVQAERRLTDREWNAVGGAICPLRRCGRPG